MTTTELIELLKRNEKGGISHRSREISLTINGRKMLNPEISLSSTGDGICGAEIDLDIVGDFTEKPNKWIPLTKRPMTEEEREECKEMTGITERMIFDCPLPEDGQEVLVCYGSYVFMDTFHDDDGCYFEDVEIDEAEAWMPLPLPYKPESEE